MKTKFICFATTFLLLTVVSFGQTKGTLYKAEKWLDIKGKGSWAKANISPTVEKVEILQTDKNIKVTFGTKVYNYKIVSSETSVSSSGNTKYNVALKGKSGVIYVLKMFDDSIIIKYDNDWQVSDPAISTVDIN